MKIYIKNAERFAPVSESADLVVASETPTFADILVETDEGHEVSEIKSIAFKWSCDDPNPWAPLTVTIEAYVSDVVIEGVARS